MGSRCVRRAAAPQNQHPLPPERGRCYYECEHPRRPVPL